MAAAQKMDLPEDFWEAARGEGLRKSVLEIYFKLQVFPPRASKHHTPHVQFAEICSGDLTPFLCCEAGLGLQVLWIHDNFPMKDS